MCVNNLSKVALDSAAVGIEPAISSRKSNALTTTLPSHTNQTVISPVWIKYSMCDVVSY